LRPCWPSAWAAAGPCPHRPARRRKMFPGGFNPRGGTGRSARRAVITVGCFVWRERGGRATPAGRRDLPETRLEARRSPGRSLAVTGPGAPWWSAKVGRITVPGMFKSYGAVGSWRDVKHCWVYVPLFGLLTVRVIAAGSAAAAIRWPGSLPFYLAVLNLFPLGIGGAVVGAMTPALFLCLWFALEPWGRRRTVLSRRSSGWRTFAAGLAYWIGRDLPRAPRLGPEVANRPQA